MNKLIETPETPKCVKLVADRFNEGKPKLVYGIAMNDAPYKVDEVVGGKRITCHFYNTWKNMLSHCYGKQSKGKYMECTVSSEWLVFSVFREWMRQQDYEGKFLDKDLMKAGNTVYSPEFCAFVSTKLNGYLIRPNSRKKLKYKLGVSRNPNGWWYSRCKLWDDTSYSCCHRTEEEAHRDYVRVKIAEIRKIIKVVDSRLKIGLESHIQVLENSIDNTETKAKRYNSGKPEMSYLMDFPTATSGVVEVMMKGAEKYGSSNWQLGGLELRSYVDSLLRHMQARLSGVTFDDETGLDHLYHVAVNALMLAEMYGKRKE